LRGRVLPPSLAPPRNEDDDDDDNDDKDVDESVWAHDNNDDDDNDDDDIDGVSPPLLVARVQVARLALERCCPFWQKSSSCVPP
jgi:hypothetical protein